METINYILNKYNIKWDGKSVIKLPISRWKEYPLLLKEVGFLMRVEIGTYKGKYAEVLCNAIEGLDLTAVDAWKVYAGYKDYGVTDLEDEAYRQTLERAKATGFKIIKAWSLDAVKEFENESLDFVFIDGNHDFRHCTEDVDEWSKKVKKGGIVSGHDFFRNHKKEFGVKEAVTGWCEAYDIKPLFVIAHDQCPSWFYIKQ